MEKMTDSERIEESQVLVRAIIEMAGAPKEHLESTIKGYIEKLKKEEGVDVIKSHVAEAELRDPETAKDVISKQLLANKKIYTTFAEIEVWFKNNDKLIAFCFDYMPSSVEVLKPETMNIKAHVFSGLLNDLEAKLHKLDMALKIHITDKQAAGSKFNTLISNFMIFCIKKGINNTKEIALTMGIEEKKAEEWLGQLTEKKIINKKDNIYSI